MSKKYMQRFYICTSSKCPLGHPHWRNTGKPVRRKCQMCGGPLRMTKSEPKR
jgi:hypothetical protein